MTITITVEGLTEDEFMDADFDALEHELIDAVHADPRLNVQVVEFNRY